MKQLNRGDFVKMKCGSEFNTNVMPDWQPKPKIARVRKVENNKVWLDYRLGWTDITKLETVDDPTTHSH